MVLNSPANQLQGLGRTVAGRRGAVLLIGAVDDRPRKGRRVHPHVVRRDDSLQPPSAHVDLHLVVFQGVAVHEGKAN